VMLTAAVPVRSQRCRAAASSRRHNLLTIIDAVAVLRSRDMQASAGVLDHNAVYCNVRGVRCHRAPRTMDSNEGKRILRRVVSGYLHHAPSTASRAVVCARDAPMYLKGLPRSFKP
jgi:hypothetical protein